MRLLVALIVGFIAGAALHDFAIEQERRAHARTLGENITDDIDWLSEYLLTRTPDPAAARSN